MSGPQASAFQTSGGFPPSASYLLFVGFAIAITFLWAAWATWSCYRGWATGNLEQAIAAPSVVRVLLLSVLLAFFILSWGTSRLITITCGR
nr:TIGR03758 family integrating conjugative element protein [uncultured Pseudomonas sp.]